MSNGAGACRSGILAIVAAAAVAVSASAVVAAETKPEGGVASAVKDLITKATKKPKPAKPSPCKGLVQTACAAVPACRWVTFKTNVDKRGRPLKPYCRIDTPPPKPKKV